MSKFLKLSLRMGLVLVVCGFFSHAAHAQAASPVISFSVGSASGSSESVGYDVSAGEMNDGTTAYGYAYFTGITGNGGTTTYECQDSVNGVLVSGSSSTDVGAPFSYTVNPGYHSVQCDAFYSGTTNNSFVFTNNITFVVY